MVRPERKSLAFILEPEFIFIYDRKEGKLNLLLITERSFDKLISVTDMSKPSDLVQGTLDLLILKIVALEPMNGWAISLRLKQVSGDVLQVSDGSLYPALHKLEQEGWISSEWKQSENNRRAKFYTLTELGRSHLEKEAANWSRLSAAISQVVGMEG
jgi:PadR family transcriptional regulator PadR